MDRERQTDRETETDVSLLTLSVYHPPVHDSGHKTSTFIVDLERDALKHKVNTPQSRLCHKGEVSLGEIFKREMSRT